MDVLCLFIDLCTKAVYMLKGHGKNFTTIQPDAGCLQRDHGLVLECACDLSGISWLDLTRCEVFCDTLT